jgi:hypothetical protein
MVSPLYGTQAQPASRVGHGMGGRPPCINHPGTNQEEDFRVTDEAKLFLTFAALGGFLLALERDESLVECRA